MLSPRNGTAGPDSANLPRAPSACRHPSGLEQYRRFSFPEKYGGPAMFRVDAGKTAAYCDGLSRRSFLQLGVAGMASLGLGDVLRARALSAAASERKDTAVILLWLDGGPSHMDLYDLKPEAPPEYRGFWKPIKTNVPGMEISELFPKQARVADKFSIVRSLHHDTGDHFTGGHWMLT